MNTDTQESLEIDIDKQLQKFQAIVFKLQNPNNLCLNEKDIQVLSEIKDKIINITEINEEEEKAKKKKLYSLKSTEINKKKHLMTNPRSISFFNNKMRLSQFLSDKGKTKNKEFGDLVRSFEYFCDYLMEKADQVLKLRIATINSDISFKTGDFFFTHFSSIILESSNCCLIQRKLEEETTLCEVYGCLKKKKVRRFFFNFQRD